MYVLVSHINDDNFGMVCAMNLQQASTCFLDKDLQFDTHFEQIECFMDVL